MSDAPRYRDGFDATPDAVVLTSYDAVSTALDNPRLAPLGGSDDDASRRAHRAVRRAARDAFSRARLGAWEAELAESARGFASQIADKPLIDLIDDVATPYSLALAMRTLGAPAEADATPLAALARTIFLDAAYSTTGDSSPDAQHSAGELARSLAVFASSTALDVQSFVALSQTLPALLGSMWVALLEHPLQLAALRDGANLDRAIDELLRFAGPSRAVFRRALDSSRIGTTDIVAGQRVILLLAAANRDPSRFPDPDRLDISRDAAAHVAFGHGGHSCVGGSIVRLAASVATRAFLEHLPAGATIHDVTWVDGFAIRAPSRAIAAFTAPSCSP